MFSIATEDTRSVSSVTPITELTVRKNFSPGKFRVHFQTNSDQRIWVELDRGKFYFRGEGKSMKLYSEF